MYLIPALALLLAGIALAPRMLCAAEGAGTTAYEEMVVELRINEQDSQEMLVVLRDATGGFWIDTADLARLRLKAPSTQVVERAGQRFLPLSAFGGSVRFEAALAMLAP